MFFWRSWMRLIGTFSSPRGRSAERIFRRISGWFRTQGSTVYSPPMPGRPGYSSILGLFRGLEWLAPVSYGLMVAQNSRPRSWAARAPTARGSPRFPSVSRVASLPTPKNSHIPAW